MAHLIAFVRRTVDEFQGDAAELVATLRRVPAEDWKAAGGWLLGGAIVLALSAAMAA